MRAAQSDYMFWAKHQSKVRYALSSSEVPHFRLDRLPLTIANLELDGASHPSYPPLREAIAARYEVNASQVVAADGTSMANFLAMAALIEAGDEVVFERPAYEPMLATARFLGADIRFVDRNPDHGFRLDPNRIAAALTDRTRLIALTNLHNPSGALTSRADLATIGALAVERGARVLIDEVYLDAAAIPQRPAAKSGPPFVSTSSLTKVYGLSGLRCGWVIAEPTLVERMVRLNDLFGVNQAHQAERLACIAFANLEIVFDGMLDRLTTNRTLLNDFIAGRDDLECMPAAHGLTAFPRWAGGDTERLDAVLRARFDTSVVPGKWFDYPDRFRLGLGGDTAMLAEGLARIGSALDALR